MQKRLAAGYIALILLIVALADLGVLGALIGWVHALPLGDKVFHFLFAVGLAGAVDLGFARTFSIPFAGKARQLRSTAFILVPLVLAEECSQAFIPGRTFDFGDLAADALGIGLGLWLAARFRKPSRTRTAPLEPSPARS